jgi:hypothetical protein
MIRCSGAQRSATVGPWRHTRDVYELQAGMTRCEASKMIVVEGNPSSLLPALHVTVGLEVFDDV